MCDNIIKDLAKIGERNPNNMSKLERPRVIYVRSGIANRFYDCIELHEDLKKYPKLQGKILQHEFGHTPAYFSFKDFLHDIKADKNFPLRELFWFIVLRPETRNQFYPIYRHPSRGWVYDLNKIIIHSIFFTSLFIVLYFTIGWII